MATELMMADTKRYHQLLIRPVNRSSEDLRLLRFEKANMQHITVACLYATIVQSIRECPSLMSVLASVLNHAATRLHEFLTRRIPPGYAEDRRELEPAR